MSRLGALGETPARVVEPFAGGRVRGARKPREGDTPTVPTLHVWVLGGFRVERAGAGRPVSDWQRHAAKTLTKLLAIYPGHALHQEQILDILWRDVEVDSALNSFRKALHAARRAFEPHLLPRESSAYLRLSDAMLALDARHVVVDADRFQELAESALRGWDVRAYEVALSVYGGELLPENRYHDWCSERRSFLAELNLRLRLGLADLLERKGAYTESADRLCEVLQHDPTREDVHRRLIRLYAGMGTRDRAVRQFHVCQGVLQRELGLQPERETLTLYEDVVANRVPKLNPGVERDRRASAPRGLLSAERTAGTPLVGRELVLAGLEAQLARAEGQAGGMILVGGEAGIGKTRLVAEFAARADGKGATVLWGGSDAHANHLPYGPLSVALEGYVASRPEAERDALAQRYPALVHFVPSLGASGELPPLADRPGDDRLYLLPTIVRLLTDLARTTTVLLVLGDLQEVHTATLDLLPYLARLAVERRWLVLATFREDEGPGGPKLRRMIEAATRERLCIEVDLGRLSRRDCDQLVRSMLPGDGIGEELLEHVFARSEGTPLFVEELVSEMLDRDELTFSAGFWQQGRSPVPRVPVRVRAMVAMRMAPMDESVRRVLALAATTSHVGVSLVDLRRGAAALDPPISDAVLFDALDRALEAGMLVERDDAFAFAHPLVRSALYENLPKHRRDQLHAALGTKAS